MRWPAPAAQRFGYGFWSVIVLLAGVAIYPWAMPASSTPRPAQIAGKPHSTPRVETLPPIVRFTAVFQRPLFSPLRRPDLPERQPGAANGLGGRYQLLGVVHAGEVRRALVADGDRKVELHEGSLLDGWTAMQIDHDRVVFSSSAGRAVLTLRRPGAVPAEAHAPVPPAVVSKNALNGEAREPPPAR